MLKFEKLPVTIKTFKPYGSKQGKAGIELKVAMSTSSDVLDQVAPGLSAALYRRPDVISAQTTGDSSPARFSQVKAIEIDYQVIGATIEIERDDMLNFDRLRYSECEVYKVRPELEDTSCDWTYLIRVPEPKPQDVGVIFTLLKKVVLLTLIPPEAASYAPADTKTGSLPLDDEQTTEEAVANAMQAQVEADGAKGKRGRKAAGAEA